MDWIEDKSVWLGCPYFADVFEGCEALEGFEPPPVIVGVNEVVEVGSQLRVAVVVVSLDRSLLDRPIHPFDLAVSPWMFDLGQPVLNAVFVAPHIEHVSHIGGGGTVCIAWREGELDAVIGQHRVDL